MIVNRLANMLVLGTARTMPPLTRSIMRLTKMRGYYQMATLSKMSAIMKEIALVSFKNPKVFPSSEAAHASLLFAQVAWNRTLGHDMQDYKELLKVFLRLNPNLWSELRSRDAEEPTL